MKKLFSPLKIGMLIFFFITNLTAFASEQKVIRNNWKTECVGLSLINVPSNVELAVHPLKKIYHELSTDNAQFSNGDFALYTSLWANGTVLVSPILRQKEFEKYRNEFTRLKNDALALKTKISSDKKSFTQNWLKGASFSIYSENRIYEYEISALPQSDAIKLRDNFVSNFRSRELFEIPQEPGVCFSYGFIKNDGTSAYDIRIAMRLLDHPDVEIFFKDANATGDDPNTAPQFKGSRGQVENFWSFYGPSRGNKLEGTLSHYHDIQLGGYPGKYAFATIARAKDPYKDRPPPETYEQFDKRMQAEIDSGKYQLDYGFMAAYKGDPDKPDEPDLMLYVIRTASRAIAAGKKPVSKEELKEMALQIAASIKRREVR